MDMRRRVVFHPSFCNKAGLYVAVKGGGPNRVKLSIFWWTALHLTCMIIVGTRCYLIYGILDYPNKYIC
jgi:hypothetical protein